MRDSAKAAGMERRIAGTGVLEERCKKVGRWCSESGVFEMEIMRGWHFYVNDNV